MSEENINISQEQQEEDINELIKIRIEKLKDLQEKGKDPFQIVKFDNKDNSKDIKEKFVDPVEGEEPVEVVVSMGGRLMSKRGHGKATFCDLQDMYGRIQIYVKLDEVGAESYEEFKKYDLDKHFIHALGHGVGLDVHERPYISTKSVDEFKSGIVVAIEPGIYLPNKFGVRIEDMVVITD